MGSLTQGTAVPNDTACPFLGTLVWTSSTTLAPSCSLRERLRISLTEFVHLPGPQHKPAGRDPFRRRSIDAPASRRHSRTSPPRPKGFACASREAFREGES